MPLRALRLSHAAHAFRNAFASSGFRRFGPRFARDYLRIAAGAAGRWGGTDAATLRLLGRDVRVSNRTSGVFLVHEIFVHGAYDFHPARPDPVILDCGANVGMASLYFRLRFPRARIVAVEPAPAAFRLLRDNVRGLDVDLVEAAVTEDGAPATFYASPDDVASLSGSVAPELGGGAAAATVQGITLSALLERAGGEADFLKLDVEGAEYGIFREARRTGALRRVREVAAEYHALAGESVAFLVDVLRESGFAEIGVETGISGVDGIVRARRAERGTP